MILVLVIAAVVIAALFSFLLSKLLLKRVADKGLRIFMTVVLYLVTIVAFVLILPSGAIGNRAVDALGEYRGRLTALADTGYPGWADKTVNTGNMQEMIDRFTELTETDEESGLIETIAFWFIRYKTAAGTESLSFLIDRIGGGKDVVTMGELSERAFAEISETVLSAVFWIRIGVTAVYLLFLIIFAIVSLSLRKTGQPRINRSITFGDSN
ncbi:MAG: hypothetical protein SOZ27_00720 [Spirochaetia bacterium]|nr:hypothetical protein [Spirochaetia bacterium]